MNRDHAKSYHRTLRRQIVEAYGSKCVCCGESRFHFLSLDHVNNDGAKELKAIRRFSSRKSKNGNGISSVGIWRLVKKAGFPKDRYRLLCYNCNIGRHRNFERPGICPHELERGVIVSVALSAILPLEHSNQLELPVGGIP